MIRWPWQHREPHPTDDARHALEHARRSLDDAQALGRYADELDRRAEVVGDRWREIKRTNHVAKAAVDSILRKARNP